MHEGNVSATKLDKDRWAKCNHRWYYESARKVAFEYLGQRQLSELDEIELTQAQAERLHELGQENRIPLPDSALRIFSVHFFLELENISDECELFNMLQPKKQYKDAVNYGLYCDFFVRKNAILLAIAVDESHNDTAGVVELGVLFLAQNGRGGYDVQPLDLCAENDVFTDRESLTTTALWLGELFNGIQHKLVHKPETVSVQHLRIPKEEREQKKNRKTKDKVRVVKVRRVIRFLDEDAEAPELPEADTITRAHEYTLPVWGVCGHFRHYKSGKVVWIHPYKKGKDRNKEGVYCGKQYQFIKEDSQG